MLTISSILGKLIKEYQEEALANDRDSRIVVPGLTAKIAREFHEYLVSNGITSYLVIGDELAPDEEKSWIRPVGLTSKRIGSFVAVACPGQLSQIQDSIRGSGGTIRAAAFSEEWPWIDGGNEAFRFDGPVLRDLVSHWDGKSDKTTWLSDFVLKCLVPATRAYPRRSELLLEEILGQFSPSLYPEIKDLRLKLLFHAGLPCPESVEMLPPVEELTSATSRICERIVDRCRKEDNVRQSALLMVPEVFPEKEKDEAIVSLNAFLDALGQSKVLDLGPLAFFGCWAKKTEHWLKLNAPRLERLFEIEPRESAQITYQVECERSIISGSGNAMATFHGENLHFSGTYRLPPGQLDRFDWTIRLTCRQSELASEKISKTEGEFQFHLNTEEAFSRYRKVLPLKLALLSKGEIRAEKKLKLHLCGNDRPAFALVEPSFEVIDASVRDEDEVLDKKIVTDEAVYVYLFSLDGEEPRFLDQNENEQSLIETGSKGIWRSGYRVDPSEEASGQVIRLCEFGKLISAICLEAKDIERGEFTLEDELRVQISGERKGRLKEILAIFEGSRREPYRWLGKLNDASRRRILLASDMTNEHGWHPFLVDLLGSKYDSLNRIGEYVSCRGTISAPGFNRLVLPDRAIELVHEYASCRSKLIKVTLQTLEAVDKTLEHPVYCTHPVYVDRHAGKTEDLLVKYLQAYRDILDYVEKEKKGLDWNQLFVLLHLDCVVNWDDTDLRNSLFLVGPWHPLVLAKRYMVQAALVARAQRLEEKDGKAFSHLTVLLKGIAGFRWIPGLHRDDKSLEPLHVLPSSDPGWHVAIKQDLGTIAARAGAGSLEGVLERIRDQLGLETPIIEASTEDLVCSGIASFTRAFPSRRSLGIRVRRGYSTVDVLSSIDRFLHANGSPTDMGKQLPGGIRLFCEEPAASTEDIKWSDPPILAYNYGEDKTCLREMKTDIYLLAPTRNISFRPETEPYFLPRGLGNQSVFNEPLSWLTEGQTQLPNSVSQEFDAPPREQDGLGEAYVGSTSKVCEILENRVVMVRSVNLPQSLDCPWAVAPGGGLDPAIFVKYVRDGVSRSLQDRALWDYKVDIGNSQNTFYVLSTIPRGFAVAVNGFFGKGDVAGKFIEELGALGIAIGGEALKSGRHALGVVGLVGAIRLLNGTGGNGKGAFRQGKNRVGFLVPVDSFVSFFGKKPEPGSEIEEHSRRTDLLAIQLVFPSDGGDRLRIYACGIESKFVSRTLSQENAKKALEQALASLERFRDLVKMGLNPGGMAERLGLLAILKFGLRISSPSKQEDIHAWIETEQRVFQSILQGQYEYKQAVHDAVVVSTEGQLPGVAEANQLSGGIWIRINQGHWPGVSDTPQLDEIRELVARLFEIPVDMFQEHGDREVFLPADVAHGSSATITNLTVPELEQPCSREEKDDRQPEKLETGERVSDTTFVVLPTDHSGTASPLKRILLGVDDARRPVFLDPQSRIDPLDNLNLMVTGSPGTGKTQLLKYLICKIREQGKNVLILDFKNDFASDRVFADRASLERVFVSFDGLPFNPLIPYPIQHPGTGASLVQIGQHISGIASVLKRTYNLGPQQQMAVKNAIADAFSAMGIPTSGASEFNPSLDFPDLGNVGEKLHSSNISAYNRLDPLFTLDLFKSSLRRDSFYALVNRSMIVDFSQIPSDEIKNTLAELIVLSAHAYYNAQPHSGSIRQVLVFDEAHRVLGSGFMTNLVRECRAYGVGMILSSQYPSDFRSDISSSMATKVLHGNGRDFERVKAIVQLIGCAGREADVADLDRFQAFVDNRHFPHTLIRMMNYPLYLVWSSLSQHEETTREEIANLEGIDISKLPIDNLVRQLERLGLVEEKEGRIRLLKGYE
jgi:DNA phosphorothioation-dependent restriction protein DptH